MPINKELATILSADIFNYTELLTDYKYKQMKLTENIPS